MSRTPIRDEFRRRPATPTTVARTTTAQGRKRNVGLGLVPSQGWGGGHRRHLNPSINQCTQFSYLGVPAAAGINDWYENSCFQSKERHLPLGLVPNQGHAASRSVVAALPLATDTGVDLGDSPIGRKDDEIVGSLSRAE